jgi:hypothetical protein
LALVGEPIDWADPLARVSKYFNVRECLWLPRWQRLASGAEVSPTLLGNVAGWAARMDQVRDWFAAPLNIHVWLRPPAYNELIGGAAHSAHLEGIATDFDVTGLACPFAVDRILQAGMLDKWGMRLEDNAVNGNPVTWLHLDGRAPGESGRYFVP